MNAPRTTLTTPATAPTASAAAAGAVTCLRNGSALATVRQLAASHEHHDGPHLHGCARPREEARPHAGACLYAHDLATSGLPGHLRAANLVRLASAVDDAEPTAHELRLLRWLANWEPETVAVLVSVLQRGTTANAAGTAPGSTAGTAPGSTAGTATGAGR